MNDLAVWIIGWDESGNRALADHLRTWGNIPHVFTYTNFSCGESENYNHCIRASEESGYRYMMALDADVEIPHEQTIPKMYEWIASQSQCGSIRPWREGEPVNPSAYPPDKKYIDDGTALMWRIGIGIYWCEELSFTGWMDLEFGCELEYHGYANYNDRRWPVKHSLAGSRRHSSSNALQALKKRNKLIHDFKWYLVGRDKWSGVGWYNANAPLERCIPTINQIVAYSNEDQDRFNQSVSPEHHQIWVKDGHENPNLVWKNPMICGYSTREEFERTHGYS
jgi:hypothetical protein